MVRAEERLRLELARTLPQRRSPAVHAAHQLYGSPLVSVLLRGGDSDGRVLEGTLARATLLRQSAEDVPSKDSSQHGLPIISHVLSSSPFR